MRNFRKNDDGSFTVTLYLREDERRRLKRLAKKLGMNDFDAIKYCIRLVSWWSKNEIEPEEEASHELPAAL